MAQITVLNQATMALIRRRLEEEIGKVGIELGINFDLNKILYNTSRDNSFGCRLEGALIESTNGRTVETATNAILAGYGLSIGTKLRINGKGYVISGYNSRKPKNCIELEGNINCGLETAQRCKA